MNCLRGIAAKVAIAVALTVGLACALLVVSIHGSARGLLFREANDDALRLAETIWRSTRSGMLDGHHERIRDTIAFVAHQGDIERIELLDHAGVIRYSSEAADEGRQRTPSGPGCGRCHPDGQKGTARTRPPWSFQAGPSTLGVVRPLYNLPECQRSGCHAPDPGTGVLGLLHVGVSLRRHESSVVALRQRLLLIAGVSTLLLAAAVFLLLDRLVGRPVGRLVEGTRRLAAGDLDRPIAIGGNDEIGELARTFNENTEKLARAQRQLLDMEKLASVGRLAAGVAHEINNPLTGILTYAEVLRDELGAENARHRADLDAIVGETLRCREIVHRLLDFARQRPPSKRLVDLNQLVERALSLLERQLPLGNVTLVRRLGTALPLARLDANQIHQVLVNLVINATDAMPTGGTLTVETATSADASQVLLRVTDTGGGIPPEVRTHLFEPFFTTKPMGTGLGLSVAWGIIQRHQGRLSFVTELGKGTTFTVELPIERGAVAAEG